jgi:genome maintenance exonuclease 1
MVRIDGEIRQYQTPEGNIYPSVTTILGKMSDHSFLDDWAEKIGENEAEKITKRSARRGSSMHSILERYVLNQDLELHKEMPINVSLFSQIRKHLDLNLTEVYCSEGRIYSDKLKVAGSVDLVGKWKGKNAIIDFKSSGKSKKAEWVENYFLQGTLYSMAWWERTGMICNDVVILIGCEEENKAQAFEVKASDWIDKARKICCDYHNSS